MREALFSRLESLYGLAGSRVLDLFAGSGALGIEALSRGARELVSVERSRRAARVLIANLHDLGVAGRAEVLVTDAAAAIASLARRSVRFDGVFVDPPYRTGQVERVLAALAERRLLCCGGWVVVETERGEPLPERVGDLLRMREDVYGDTRTTLYEMATGVEELE